MKKQLLLFAMMIVGLSVNAQGSRSYIKESIKEWGGCKNVAITKTNGDVALYGKNGYSCSAVPSGLKNKLSELNNSGKLIDDVQLTENGNWLVLYGDNGVAWSGIPYDLESKLREFNDAGEVITSVTFNDAGDWIVITTEHFSTSDSNISAWLKEGLEGYGQIWAVCVTDDAMVAVYERGYKFLGEVPSGLKTTLKNTSINAYRVKIAGQSWFIADKNGTYHYNM